MPNRVNDAELLALVGAVEGKIRDLKGVVLHVVSWNKGALVLYGGDEYYFLPDAREATRKFSRPVYLLLEYSHTMQMGALVIREAPNMRRSVPSVVKKVYTEADFYTNYLEVI